MIRAACFLLLIVGLFACAAPTQHGTHSTLTTSAESLALCSHKVPGDTCTRCHPELVGQFKTVNDWCVEHDIPESQCLLCHPDLTFEPLPQLPAGADLQKISHAGEDFGDIASRAARGKVTLVDFYADWCAPCRKIDAHVYGLMSSRDDLALRKVNVVSWETPVAKRHLAGVQSLPYIVVLDREGKVVESIVGFDLEKLDVAIAAASAK